MASFIDNLVQGNQLSRQKDIRQQISQYLQGQDATVAAISPTGFQLQRPDNSVNSFMARNVVSKLSGDTNNGQLTRGPVPDSMFFRRDAPVMFGDNGQQIFKDMTDAGIKVGSSLSDVRRFLDTQVETNLLDKSSIQSRPTRQQQRTDLQAVNNKSNRQDLNNQTTVRNYKPLGNNVNFDTGHFALDRGENSFFQEQPGSPQTTHRKQTQSFMPDKSFDMQTANAGKPNNVNNLNQVAANNSLHISDSDFANIVMTNSKKFDELLRLILPSAS